ncbi:flagellar hook protein FlgE [Bacillus sp. 123MFChir2]|uniref:flagellar hook protein FlgE n=1 Tax=Bacillus sp. 123MFChir2 TaxID=1169144 RepID=UPI0003774880|nr:flagellar hook protein FlgE [Bacillus sp. 123MFChir2]
MIKALYTSITGMNAMQNALSITSNNIANSQTVGYKKQKAMFDDLLYNNTMGARGDENYAGTNPKSIGNGVRLSGTTTDYSAGPINMTNGKTDAAIDGNGFFVVGDSKGGNVQYTRKGTFSVSNDYYIVNSEGKYVLAYPTKPGKQDIDFSNAPQPMKVPMGSAIPGTRTDHIEMTGNVARTDAETADEFSVYDEEGNTFTMRVELKQVTDAQGKPVAGEYKYRALVRKEHEQTYTEIVNNKNLKFNNLGELIQTDTAVVRDPATNKVIQGGKVTIPFGAGVEVDFSGATNYPTKKTITHEGVTGRPAATVEDCEISEGGYIMVKYSDGSSRAAGQLAVATFANEQGLMKIGNGNYVSTPSAGDPAVGVSGQNGTGTVRGKSQEGSNVDLAVEFVDLMVYQKGFTGNTKVIKVADDVLNEVVNLIR